MRTGKHQGMTALTARSLNDLARLPWLCASVASVWSMVLLDRAVGGPAVGGDIAQTMPLLIVLILAGGFTAGIQVFGLALNDLLDVRRDRLFDPARPLPAGRAGAGAALVVSITALLVGLACAVPLGMLSSLLAMACAAMVVFYNATARFVPAAGLVLLGLIGATAMLVPVPSARFCWPVWVTLTHVIGFAAAAHTFARKRPRLKGWHLWGVVGGWAFWSMVLITWMTQRDALGAPGHRTLWFGPIIAAALFTVICTLRVRAAGDRREAGRLLMHLGMQWLGVYGLAWLVAGQLWWQAAVVAAIVAIGWLGQWLWHDVDEPPRSAAAYRR